MSPIIAWHLITNLSNETDPEDLKQNYIEVLQSGVLLPPSHRNEKVLFLRNPTIYGADALAGDDDSIFLSLLPYGTANYFLAQSNGCYFGPEIINPNESSPNLTQENTWVYGNCELRNGGLRRSRQYGFGFDITQLIQEGASFGTEDLIDRYHKAIETEEDTISHILDNISYGRPPKSGLGWSGLGATALPNDPWELKKIQNLLSQLGREKLITIKPADITTSTYLKNLKIKLQKIQNTFRLSGPQALDAIQELVNSCASKFDNYYTKLGDAFSGCRMYEKAEVIYPGPLTLDKVLYFIEDGIVYRRDGKLMSDLNTPTYSRWEPSIKNYSDEILKIF